MKWQGSIKCEHSGAVMSKVKPGDPLRIPLAACVAKVYEDRDFSQLGIGT